MAISACQAGCAFEIGEAADCPCQPMSLNALLVVKDVEALREFVRFGQPKPGENTDSEKKKRIKEALISTGHFPSYASSTLWHVRGNLIFAMMNHEYGIKPWDAAEITAATVRARAEMNKMVQRPAQPRRTVGRHSDRRHRGADRRARRPPHRGPLHRAARTISSKARAMTTRVVRVTFGVDVHATSADHNKKSAIHATDIKVKPYDIPLRALIAKDVDGLMMAGPLHQRRFHLALQLPRHRQRRRHGRSRRRHRRARRAVETPAARGRVERGRGETEGDGAAGVAPETSCR